MAWEDGSLPLVNDSANGIAPSLLELERYAGELGLAAASLELGESGYRKYRGPDYELLADVGEIGPDYIPGHAHSDTLGFLMQIEKKPFLVDTGISTYEKNQSRQWERSTAAHNTVQLGEWEQSEVWGGFRVARRARPSITEETAQSLAAEHDGYVSIGGRHQRKWTFENGSVMLEDAILSAPGDGAKAFFHFAPDINVTMKEGESTVNTSAWTLAFEGASRIEISEYPSAGEYNRTRTAWKLTVHFHHHLQTIIRK